ncbi:3-oxoacyl-ACP synthase [Micromonospora rosaria]|uniref:3-oxoacyl-ACP synthase n=1 Tax=Micromonospora rosaria TaxID=47874 RepID=A0A136PZN0_9ACTN|nr:beta-ketoacyl-ACP synthase 3 [Micromonospora rosaria]KXK63833.1 3-oxoacyl-ACP synthase [Micromonospora rosaria]
MPVALRRNSAPVTARMLGLGVYRPSTVVDNEEIAPQVGRSAAWIESRSGIRQRRFATDEETLVRMSVTAAQKAAAAAGIDVAEIDCVVAATTTHLTQMPSLGSMVAYQIGRRTAAGFDVSAACAGFCHALALGHDLVAAGSSRYTLVLGAERISDILDRSDPSTAFLFADGAGAVVVGPGRQAGIGPVVWGSDGSRAAAVGMTGYWLPELQRDPERAWPVLGMSGWRVFRWATSELAPIARAAMDAAGVTARDLSAFIPHQANLLISQAVATALELGDDVVVATDIRESGNTSAASIPLAMDRLLRQNEVTSGDLALLIGFGSGMVYAAQVVEIP